MIRSSVAHAPFARVLRDTLNWPSSPAISRRYTGNGVEHRQTIGIDVNLPSNDQASLFFNFRSQRFCDDAHALMRATGCSLAECRQELFIAEGDLEEAQVALVFGRAASCQLLH